MSPAFARTVKRVAVAHVALVALIVLGSLLPALLPRRRRTMAIPVDFRVALPATPAVREAPARAAAPPRERPVAREKTVRPPIRRSRERAVRSTGSEAKPDLTQEQIEDLLRKGAKPSDRTVIPAEEQRYFAIIRRALYGAWDTPSAAEAGDAVAEVALRILPGGRVSSWRIVRPSGNAVLDASVAQALRSVRKIDNLSTAFLQSHPEVTISFKVVR